MAKTKTISVKGTAVSVLTQKKEDYISLTDIGMLIEAITSYRTGCETEAPLSSLVYGSNCITPVLIPSNSMGLIMVNLPQLGFYKQQYNY